MIKYLIVAVVISGSFAAPDISGVTTLATPQDNCSTVTGYTWVFNATSDESHPGIDKWETCQTMCLDAVWCRAWTWEDHDVTGHMCYLFRQKETVKACSDCSHCVSGEYTPNPYPCFGEVSNIIQWASASTQMMCYELCRITSGCKFYSWNKPGGTFTNYCVLFKACVEKPVCEPWITKSVECIGTIRESTSTTTPPPSQCTNYQVLNDSTRSVTYGTGRYGDYKPSRYFKTSPDWGNATWYRMEAPAGVMMPETAPGKDKCGTLDSGYLDGKHPENIYETIDGKACFCGQGDDCVFSRSIKITNCNGYFVYFLEQTNSYYPSRYCAGPKIVVN